MVAIHQQGNPKRQQERGIGAPHQRVIPQITSRCWKHQWALEVGKLRRRVSGVASEKKEDRLVDLHPKRSQCHSSTKPTTTTSRKKILPEPTPTAGIQRCLGIARVSTSRVGLIGSDVLSLEVPGSFDPDGLFSPIDVWSTKDQLIRWRQDFEGWFSSKFEQNQAALLESRERELHHKYGYLLSWQARKVHDCLRSIHETLHREGQWSIFTIDDAWSSFQVNERNTVRAVYWIEGASRKIDEVARERAAIEMKVGDQLDYAHKVLQGARDEINIMKRTIAEAKAVVTKQGDLLQQLRQASA